MDAMSQQPSLRTRLLFCLLILVFLVTACEGSSTPATDETPIDEILLEKATPTEIITPTATQVPAAAMVNGEIIPLSLFENEFNRYLISQEAEGNPVEDEDAARMLVLEDLIDQVLLAQDSQGAGVLITDEDVQERIDELAQDVDLAAWMTKWGYNEADLFYVLKLQMQAADQRDRILGEIPEIMDQVELRQVFAYTEDGAERALVSLNSGTEFEDVAFLYDPTTGGYLGWTPRGYLLIQVVEDAAFSLPVGSYSEIIESEIGFHIVMVIAREERPLTSDAKQTIQRNTLRQWVQSQREISTIEVLINE
jgi:parvulin-like peptidyl-prolyl isomerase